MNSLQALSSIYLRPGELYFGEGDIAIHTVLGSCVSIAVWHPQWRMGGMCHYMLPAAGSPPAGSRDGRYGDQAMELLVEQMTRRGTRPRDYQAKLFGAGNMFPELSPPSRPGVHYKNAISARHLAQRHGLNVVAEDLGGAFHRRVVFEVANGHAWVRRARSPGAGVSAD